MNEPRGQHEWGETFPRASCVYLALFHRNLTCVTNQRPHSMSEALPAFSTSLVCSDTITALYRVENMEQGAEVMLERWVEWNTERYPILKHRSRMGWSSLPPSFDRKTGPSDLLWDETSRRYHPTLTSQTVAWAKVPGNLSAGSWGSADLDAAVSDLNTQYVRRGLRLVADQVWVKEVLPEAQGAKVNIYYTPVRISRPMLHTCPAPRTRIHGGPLDSGNSQDGWVLRSLLRSDDGGETWIPRDGGP